MSLLKGEHYNLSVKDYRSFCAVVVALVLLCAGGYGEVPANTPAEHIAAPEIKNWETLRITMKRTACYGTCPIYSLEIHGDGQVIFEGGRFVTMRGRQHAHISKAEVGRLVTAFRKADFFSLNDSYENLEITDLPTCVLSIQFDDVRKSVRDRAGSTLGMPHSVRELQAVLDGIARQNHWIA